MRVGLGLVWTAVAVAFGLIVLQGYFLDLQVLTGLRTLILQWSVILAAAALLLGVVNLLAVHLSKIGAQEKGWGYSAVLVGALVVTLIVGLVFGEESPLVLAFFQYVQQPVESTLAALLAVSLTLGVVRLLSRRRDLRSYTFVITAFIVLLGTGPWLIGSNGGLHQFFGVARAMLSQIWAAGAARGLLLGVALGATATGLRILLGADRPYGD
ncbi:MAG TPA: hypothetical protein VK449_06045 [Anaerolineales bacterium]|nr:hypothetical protein [Anaerolineales bacterium]